MVAGLTQDGRDPAVEAVLLEGEQEFAFDPSRRHRIGRQDHHEPVATPQCRADLVVPLLRPQDVGVAVPDWHTMAPEHLAEPSRERPVGTGMGQEDFVGNGHRRAGNPQAWLRIASAIGWTFGGSTSSSSNSNHGMRRTIHGTSAAEKCSRPPTTTGISRLL